MRSVHPMQRAQLRYGLHMRTCVGSLITVEQCEKKKEDLVISDSLKTVKNVNNFCTDDIAM